ncbi:MAG: hypothetical protein J6039_03470, partial [Alphaproteobacteria bacterium]|nr:hypothetical protein [Alphaproteobacteria bacterium]
MPEYNLQNLLKKEYHDLWRNYEDFAELGLAHFFRAAVNPEVKKQQLDFLEKAIRKDFVVQDNKLAKLQRAFVKENLSLYLLLDFLPVWRRLA